MPAERQAPTLVDWVVIALSPALVMLMVGSLVFFLAEVLYAGQYSERLLYSLFFFVIGAVLIARISIEQGAMKARMYGLGLGIVTMLALQAFVSYPDGSKALAPFINVFLISVVWWSANKLTWDCTHLDEDRKSSGRGILVAAGLDGPAAANAAESRAKEKQGEIDTDSVAADKAEAKKRKKDSVGVLGWMARWNRFREQQRKKPHTPGTWIVYFSLAAFPIFGLGQSLIPVDDAARRRATFLQMAVYVGSGLMLLVTTSLLGLRKYLRERNAKIPAKMTMGWLGMGAALIVLFLAVGAVLPRPHSETPLVNLPQAGKEDRKASKYAMKTDDGAAGKGEGKGGQKQEAGADAKQSGKNGEKGGNAGEKGDGGGKGKDKGGKNQDGKDGDQQAKNAEQKGDNADKGGQKDNKAEGDKAADAKDKAEERDRSDSDNRSQSGVSKAMEAIGSLLKWVVRIVIAVLVIVGLFIFFLKYLAPFTAWAQGLLDWLRGLFARKERVRVGNSADEEVAAEVEERPPPFHDFPNPFDDGSAKRMTLAQLIAYTFAAFESWAWEQGLVRTPDETPNEFAARIGEAFEELDAGGKKLANLYGRALYSTGTLPAMDAIMVLQAFWRAVESADTPANRAP